MGKLDGKVALITGATSGIGRAIAELFAVEGAAVALNGRNKVEGEKIVKNISKNGGTAVFLQADISSAKTNRELISSVLSEFGRLDILVPNAGVLGLGSVTTVTEETWHQTMDINLNAVFYLMRAAIPHLKSNENKASIVVTGSIAAHKGFPNHAAYCASKGALEALVKQVAVDYAPDIRINMVNPGPIDTALYKNSAAAFPNPETVLNEVPGSLPMNRIGHPIEIAKAVLFLASDDSPWTTGSVLTVDGGSSAAG
ncbi:MAG: SDR family NAD(P)-dependent oxidoreductase [Candidatus Halalkalibacterium sp. M3_1C_030]